MTSWVSKLGGTSRTEPQAGQPQRDEAAVRPEPDQERLGPAAGEPDPDRVVLTADDERLESAPDRAGPDAHGGAGPDARGEAEPQAPGSPGGDQWQRIRAMFVDDPRGSATSADGLVEERIEAFAAAVDRVIASVKEKRRTLQAAMPDSDTEQLRQVLQQYRDLWDRLEGTPVAS